MKIGDRVGVMYDSDKEKKIIEYFGYGKYQGNEVPLEAVGWIADICKEEETKNAKILLDDGKVVYGCECWWGSETKIKKMLKQYQKEGYKIVKVCIDMIREEFKADESN